jgi:hypothetical protein
MHFKSNLSKFLFSYRLLLSAFLILSYIFVQHCFVTYSIQTSKDDDPTNNKHAHRLIKAPTFQHVKVIGPHDRQLVKRIIKKKRKKHRVPDFLSGISIEYPDKTSDDQAFYNLNNKTAIFYSQIKQDQILSYLLNATSLPRGPNGFFIEAGAFDGEHWSNTLHFELFHNWSGLLIEPSKESYRLLKNKKRKLSYMINSCLCAGKLSNSDTVKKYYVDAGPFGITTTNTTNVNDDSIYTIKCHSLDNILEKLFSIDSSVKHIDYMSLDVEGELDVLALFYLPPLLRTI